MKAKKSFIINIIGLRFIDGVLRCRKRILRHSVQIPNFHEANIRGGGKTVYVVFNYLSRSCFQKGWGRAE
jgi:hypothetical protein